MHRHERWHHIIRYGSWWSWLSFARVRIRVTLMLAYYVQMKPNLSLQHSISRMLKSERMAYDISRCEALPNLSQFELSCTCLRPMSWPAKEAWTKLGVGWLSWGRRWDVGNHLPKSHVNCFWRRNSSLLASLNVNNGRSDLTYNVLGSYKHVRLAYHNGEDESMVDVFLCSTLQPLVTD